MPELTTSAHCRSLKFFMFVIGLLSCFYSISGYSQTAIDLSRPVGMTAGEARSNGQRIDSVSYIIIKIKTNWDYNKKSNFCSLDIEKGNKYAGELYSLVNYQNTAPQTDAVYSIEKNKEMAPISSKNFNYFINVTEAFNYLAKSGWYLENVFTNISTEPESTVVGSEVFYYPKITSEPVYIFKKIVN